MYLISDTYRLIKTNFQQNFLSTNRFIGQTIKAPFYLLEKRYEHRY
jgi:hypothetical protein